MRNLIIILLFPVALSGQHTLQGHLGDTLTKLQIENERLQNKADSLKRENNILKWQLNDMEDKRDYWMQSSKRYEAAFNKRGEWQERDNRIIELKSDIIRVLQEEIEKLKKQ